MKVNRATPPVSVVPVLSYPDVRAAVAWLSAAFGFAERTRIGGSHRAQMSIGPDGPVIVAELHGEKSEHKDPVTHLIRVRVENVIAQFKRACAQGAHVVEPPTDRELGRPDFPDGQAVRLHDDRAPYRTEDTDDFERDQRVNQKGHAVVGPMAHCLPP